MAHSTVIPNADDSITKMLARGARDRCMCCGKSTLPVLEQRGDRALCHHCAQHCAQADGQYAHAKRERFDWSSVDRSWAVDLGFKRLG